MILEGIIDLRLIHVAIWCDNTSAVAWTTRMSSKRSLVGQKLTRALAIRLCTAQASPLAPLSIEGK